MNYLTFVEVISEDAGDKGNGAGKGKGTQLGALFVALVELLAKRSTSLEAKLVAQVSSLLALQIDSLSIFVLQNAINVFVNNICDRKHFHEK